VHYVDWHPKACLLASCSKDCLVKLWDPRAGGKAKASLHGHKNGIKQVRWNLNGNWVLTASRDQTVKVFDVRTLRDIVTWKGHNSEVNCAAWHPVQGGEERVSSNGHNGLLLVIKVLNCSSEALSSVSSEHAGREFGGCRRARRGRHAG
jgi:polyadenylation factor subunit 2